MYKNKTIIMYCYIQYKLSKNTYKSFGVSCNLSISYKLFNMSHNSQISQ